MVLTLVILVIVVAVLWLGSHFVIGITLIKSDEVGLVEKRFSHKGSVAKGIIALHGEAGFQPESSAAACTCSAASSTASIGCPLVTIPQGKIGYVFARDGLPLRAHADAGVERAGQRLRGRALFLEKGGQRGPQRQILREGTYAINLAQFVVLSDSASTSCRSTARTATFERMGAAIDKSRASGPSSSGGGTDDWSCEGASWLAKLA